MNQLDVCPWLSVAAYTLSISWWKERLLLCGLTWGLEIERNQLGATEPHGQRVVVGWVQPLSSGIHSGKLTPVVLQEAFPSAACRKLLCLCLWEGGHVPVACPLCPDLWKQQQITQIKKWPTETDKTWGERRREQFDPYCPHWRGQVCSRPRDQTAPLQSSSSSPFASPPASVTMEIRKPYS